MMMFAEKIKLRSESEDQAQSNNQPGHENQPENGFPGGPPTASPAGVGKLVALLLAALLFYGLLHFSELGRHFHNLLELRETLAAGGTRNLAIFIGMATALITFGTPRLIFFTLGGFLFGFVGGLLSALVATLLASLLSFNAVRWSGRQWLRQRFGHRPLVGWVTRLQPTAFSVFLVRQLPISNLLINISLAFSSVGNRAFLLGSLLGFLPLGIAATLIGSGLAGDDAWLGLLQLAMAALVIISFAIWFWRSKPFSKLPTQPPPPTEPDDLAKTREA